MKCLGLDYNAVASAIFTTIKYKPNKASKILNTNNKTLQNFAFNINIPLDIMYDVTANQA